VPVRFFLPGRSPCSRTWRPEVRGGFILRMIVIRVARFHIRLPSESNTRVLRARPLAALASACNPQRPKPCASTVVTLGRLLARRRPALAIPSRGHSSSSCLRAFSRCPRACLVGATSTAYSTVVVGGPPVNERKPSQQSCPPSSWYTTTQMGAIRDEGARTIPAVGPRYGLLVGGRQAPLYGGVG